MIIPPIFAARVVFNPSKYIYIEIMLRFDEINIFYLFIYLFYMVAFRDPRLAGKSAATATPAAGGGRRLHQRRERRRNKREIPAAAHQTQNCGIPVILRTC